MCLPQLDARERARCCAHRSPISASCSSNSRSPGWASERAWSRVPCTIEGLEHLELCRAAGPRRIARRRAFLASGTVRAPRLAAHPHRRHVSRDGRSGVRARRAARAPALRARRCSARTTCARTVKYLRRGGTVWYAPDQDMRGKDSVFVPFFGIPAATITATHHLARLSGAAVIPFFHRRRKLAAATNCGWKRRCADFPSADVIADTARVNACDRAHGARGARAISVGAQALQVAAARRTAAVLTGRGMCVVDGREGMKSDRRADFDFHLGHQPCPKAR